MNTIRNSFYSKWYLNDTGRLCHSRLNTQIIKPPHYQFIGTDIKSGHMPGAKNLPFPELIDKEKMMFKSAEEIKQQFVKAGVDPTKPFVASCVAGEFS